MAKDSELGTARLYIGGLSVNSIVRKTDQSINGITKITDNHNARRTFG